jgi:hypothetical protein
MLIAACVAARASTPAEVWSDKATPESLDKAWHELPAPLRPAVDFQKLLLRIREARTPAEWHGDVEKLARSPAGDPISGALREFARLWLARAMMEEIYVALRKYYRIEVCFPDSLALVQKDIPTHARQDPWGEAWSYRLIPPAGFTKLTKQRYQLGPARYPQLTRLADAVKPRQPSRNWKLAIREAGGAKALEMRGSDGKAAVVQPGGNFDDATLLHIGDGWALMVDTERMFTLAF